MERRRVPKSVNNQIDVNTERTTVSLRLTTHNQRRLKLAGAVKNATMSDIVNLALDEYLEKLGLPEIVLPFS